MIVLPQTNQHESTADQIDIQKEPDAAKKAIRRERPKSAYTHRPDTKRPESASQAAQEDKVAPHSELKRPQSAYVVRRPVTVESPTRPTSGFGPSTIKPERTRAPSTKHIGSLPDSLPPPKPQTAHKRYSSVYPCASQLLSKRWDEEKWRKHIEKLHTMKVSLFNIGEYRQ